MSLRLRTIVTGASLAALAFLLYSIQLGRTPLSADEIQLLQQAQSITETGRDLAGRSTPLFLQVADEYWQQPMAVYATAAMSAVRPAALASRAASALVAAISAGLLYLLLSRIHPDSWVPLLATTLFALTPIMVVSARVGLDGIYPVPFVIAWLLGMRESLSSGRLRPAMFGAFALGAGVFAQPAAPLTMGFLVVAGMAGLWAAGTRAWRPHASIVAAFALPVGLAAVWFTMHPETYPDTFGRWVIHAAHLRYPLEGLRALVNWITLGTRLSIYWGSFDPSWLFLDAPDRGGTQLRGVSPFLSVTAVLAGLGLARLVQGKATPWMLTLAAGTIVAPLAASTFGVAHAVEAFLPLVPFVVLFGAEGIADISGRQSLTAKAIGGGLALLLIVEFARFYAAHLLR